MFIAEGVRNWRSEEIISKYLISFALKTTKGVYTYNIYFPNVLNRNTMSLCLPWPVKTTALVIWKKFGLENSANSSVFWPLNMLWNLGNIYLHFWVHKSWVSLIMSTKERQFLVYFFIVRKIVLKIKNQTETVLLSQSKMLISLPFNFFTTNQGINIS